MLKIFDHYHVNIINTIVQIWSVIFNYIQYIYIYSINALLHQGCIKLVKIDSETFNIVQNVLNSQINKFIKMLLF